MDYANFFTFREAFNGVRFPILDGSAMGKFHHGEAQPLTHVTEQCQACTVKYA